MNKKKLAGVFLIVSNFAMAEPAYIECSVVNGEEKKSTFSIMLDESTRKITHTHGNGFAFNTEGFFTAGTITYKSVSNMSGLLLTDTYVIDRVSLEVSRIVVSKPENPEFEAEMPPEIVIDESGKCKVSKIEGRQI